MKKYDIAIIGGGASGLTAAISAKRTAPDSRICLLERLPRVGKKLLATGNGRCNLTNDNMDCSYYSGSCTKFYNIIEGFNTKDFFESLGLMCTSDSEGRVYPMSNTASSVLDALRLEAEKLGIDVICDFTVKDIKSGYVISSDNNAVSAKSVILCGGGLSQSSLGSDGSLLRISKNMGIKVTKLAPALTAVKTDINLVKSLKGLRVHGKTTLYCDDMLLKSEYGEIQFNEGVLSGICIFNLSTCFTEGKKHHITLDLLPEMNEKEIENTLRNIQKIRSEAPLEDFLSGILHKRLGNLIIKNAADYRLNEPCSVLKPSDIKEIAIQIKALRFPVTGLQGFEKSQVTSGGIHAEELNDMLMSKKYKGLYFCGEMLDIIGLCGGYNLTFAFASGFFAGKNAAEYIKGK